MNRTWRSLGNPPTCFIALTIATCGVACDTGGDSSAPSAPAAAEPVAQSTTSLQLAATAPSPTEPMALPTEPAPSASAARGGISPATPAAAGAKSVVKGPMVQDEPFVAWLQAGVPVNAKAKSEITLVLEAKKPYKCNDQYPYKFKVTGSSGLSVAEPTVRGMQIGKERSTMAIPVTLGAAGKATLMVFYKSDQLRAHHDLARFLEWHPYGVAVSAISGEGIPELLGELGALLRPVRVFLELAIPHDRAAVISRMHEVGQVVESDYNDGEVARFKVRIPPHFHHEFQSFVVKELQTA